MITRASRGGFCTAIPSIEDPDVFLWAPTEQDAEYMAAKEHMPLAVLHEKERVRLEQEFAAQQHAEFLKLRARA
jgi:hypothetical protein